MEFNYEIELSFESSHSSDSTSSEYEINSTTRKRKNNSNQTNSKNKTSKTHKNKNKNNFNENESKLSTETFDLTSSVEIPHFHDTDLFKPLITQNKQISMTTLPSDVVKNIVMNLNYESFVNFTSTCKTFNQLEKDEVIVRKVCGINNNYTSISECIETVKNRKTQQKLDKERKKELLKKKRINKFEHFAFCNRRLCSNIVWEILSLILIFIASIVGPTSLDRTSSVPLSATAWILFIPMLYFGVMPYFLWCWGCVIRHDHENIVNPNRDVKVYGGIFDYFNQLFLWSKRMGFRPLKYSFIVATWILFYLWTVERIEFGYVLIPSTVYTFIYWFVFTFDFGLYEYHCCKINAHRCMIYTPTTILLCIGLILTMLRSFGVFGNFYTLTMLPFSFAIIVYTILQSCRCCCFTSCNPRNSCCCNWPCGCGRCCHGVNEIDENSHESEQINLIILNIIMYFEALFGILFVILLSVLLDGMWDWKFVNVFSVFHLLLLLYSISYNIVILIIECFFTGGVECCPQIFPTNCDRLRWLCGEDLTGRPTTECNCILSPLGKFCSLIVTGIANFLDCCSSCWSSIFDCCSCCCSWICSHVCCCCNHCCRECCSWFCDCVITICSHIFCCCC